MLQAVIDESLVELGYTAGEGDVSGGFPGLRMGLMLDSRHGAGISDWVHTWFLMPRRECIEDFV